MAQGPDRVGEMAVFIRVVELGGLAPAGRTMAITPSAVSKLISRLEARLGVPLLRRSTRTLSLTLEGQRFYSRASQILAEIAIAEREAASGATPVGKIRISSSVSYVKHRLAGLLPAFLAKYRDVTVDIFQSDSVANLTAERLDLAIRSSEVSPDVIARPLGSTSLLTVAAPDWINRHGPISTIEQLANLDRVGFTYARSAGGWMSDHDPKPDRLRVSDGEGVRSMALAGAGPARLAEYAIRNELAAGDLVELLPGVLPSPSEPLHVVYVGEDDQLPARVRVFIDWLAKNGRISNARSSIREFEPRLGLKETQVLGSSAAPLND